MVIRNFSFCSNATKLSLLKSYCCNLYCSQFWFSYSKCVINKLRVAYNNGLRRFMGLPYNNSASEMFVYLNVPSFGEMLRKNVLKVKSRVSSSQNTVINVIMSKCVLTSPICLFWRRVLYTHT